MWIGFGITIPDYFVRLVERNGGIEGDAYLGWPLEDLGPGATDSTGSAALMRYEHDGQCASLARNEDKEVCHLRFRVAVPWDRVWHSLDSLGVWSVPDQAPGFRLDGWSVVVETWNGAQYRRWSYWVPTDSGPPASRRAAYVARRAAEYGEFVTPGTHERVTRGIVESRGDTLVYHECGGRRPWVLAMNDRPLRVAAGMQDSTGWLHLRVPFYAQARVLPEPEFLSRGRWNISQDYAGQLIVETIWDIRPARPSDC